VNISVGSDESDKNTVHLNFDIVEKGDGGSIQLIFAGDPTAHLVVSGTIIGAKLGIQTAYASRKEMPFMEAFVSDFRDNSWLYSGALGVLLFGALSYTIIRIVFPRFNIRFYVVVAFSVVSMGLNIAVFFFPEKYSPLGDVPPSITPSETNSKN
jgi:hypothetical protein